MDFCNGKREYYLVIFPNTEYGTRHDKLRDYCKPYCKMSPPLRTKEKDYWQWLLGFNIKNKEVIEDIILNSADKWQLITKDNYKDVLEIPERKIYDWM